MGWFQAGCRGGSLEATLPGPALKVPRLRGFVCRRTQSWAKDEQPLTHWALSLREGAPPQS